MIAVSRRNGTIIAALVLVLAVGVGITVYRVKDPTAAQPGPSVTVTSTPTESESSEPSDDFPSESDTSSSDEFPSGDDDPSSTDELPPGDLPGDLTPNAVDDECLLTAAEFEVLTGLSALRAENTELAGDGRRSCFYGPSDPESDDGPAGRVDVYASASLPPADLVSRITANSAGSRPLTGVGTGAVVVSGSAGTSELVVASATLLVVLTLLPDDTAIPPSDEAWTAAGATMVGRLPA